MRAVVIFITVSLFYTVVAKPIVDPEYKKQLEQIITRHKERLSELHAKYSGPLKVFEDQIKSEIEELEKTEGTEKEITNAQRDFDKYKRMADEVYNDRKNEIVKWFHREKANLEKYWLAIEEQRREDDRLRKLERETREREMKAYEEMQKKNAAAENQRTQQKSNEKKSKKSDNKKKKNPRRRQRRRKNLRNKRRRRKNQVEKIKD